MTRDFPVPGDLETDDELACDLTVAIAEAVADAKGTSPLALDETLYDVADPELLANLIRSFRSEPTTDGTVAFQLADCRVDIHQTGAVFVQSDAAAARPVVRSFDDGPNTPDPCVAGGNDGDDGDGDGSTRGDV